jgi:hypothetical protein
MMPGMPPLLRRLGRGVPLAVFLGADLLLIVLHLRNLVPGYGWELPPSWRLEVEGGVPERWQHLKLLALTLASLLLFRRTRYRSAAAWALVFGYVFLDDAFALHERASAALLRTSPPLSGYGLRAWDVAELLFWLAAGLPLAALLIAAYQQGSSGDRAHFRRTLWWFGVLVVFGGGLDVLHGALLPHALKTFGAARGPEALSLASSALSWVHVPQALRVAASAALLPAGPLWTLSAGSVVTGALELTASLLRRDALLTVLEDGGELLVVSLLLASTLQALAVCAPLKPRRAPLGRRGLGRS